MSTQTIDQKSTDAGTAVRIREEGHLSDEVLIESLPDGRVRLEILMGIDETDTDNVDWPTEGFAEITLPAAAWAALRAVR